MTRKAKKKTVRKKRLTKTPPGRSLRELREKEMKNLASFPWPLRPLQQEAWEAIEAGKKKLGLYWHRRYGKDIFLLSAMRNLMRQRVGNYVHFFPKTIQGRRALWNGVDPRKGARFIEIAFGDMIDNINNTDMTLTIYNGSTYQLLGSDNYDRIVGANIVFAGYSEWALCDPRAYDYIRPMQLENDGISCFITTFRNRNHAWKMYQQTKDDPEWHVSLAGVDKTVDVDGNPIITPEQIESERKTMSEALIQQEYYCNPAATSDGAIYGTQIEHLREDVQRHSARWDPDRPVYCVWNIDLPVFAAWVMVQPSKRDKPAQILKAGIEEFTTVGTALSIAHQHRWPIHQHMLHAGQREAVPAFLDLDVSPMVVTDSAEFIITHRTQSFLEQCLVDLENAEELLDALGGYVRRLAFDQQAADLTFGDALESSHWRLSKALETFAWWEYASGNDEDSEADYSRLDRIYRVT